MTASYKRNLVVYYRFIEYSEKSTRVKINFPSGDKRSLGITKIHKFTSSSTFVIQSELLNIIDSGFVDVLTWS